MVIVLQVCDHAVRHAALPAVDWLGYTHTYLHNCCGDWIAGVRPGSCRSAYHTYTYIPTRAVVVGLQMCDLAARPRYSTLPAVDWRRYHLNVLFVDRCRPLSPEPGSVHRAPLRNSHCDLSASVPIQALCKPCLYDLSASLTSQALCIEDLCPETTSVTGQPLYTKDLCP